MPSPDLQPSVPAGVVDRPLAAHLQVRLVSREDLAGGVVIVIDQLRASVTITAALAAGAPYIVPTLTVDAARAARREIAGTALLGGERGGVRIDGFDLDNSPLAYTREAIAGRPLVFTTTNGTAALLHAAAAAEVLVGSLANLSAVCRRVANDPRPVHVLACGTREAIGLDDVLAAGAFVDRLAVAGRAIIQEDSARVAREVWRSTSGRIEQTLRACRGGKYFEQPGVPDDVAFCARVDVFEVVPRFDPATGRITAA